MNKKVLITAILIVLISLIATDIIAQCPMCKMAVESNQQNGGTSAQGLNNGILYLLSMPYLLIGALVFIWIRNRKKSYDIAEEATPHF